MALACCGAAKSGELHVPSPDWRDQIIYFAMIDRFDDGDPRNNDQGEGEYDPTSGAHFSGGDLKGVIRRLDYVQDLGATALWITPPVANRAWDEHQRYGGYHGYWASDFRRVDPHFGTRADYRALSRALHGRGMYLIQDIVVNHVANWTYYDAGWRADDPTAGFHLNPDRSGRHAPTQPPFDRNDPRDPKQRAAAIYHWTPTIRDGTQPDQERNFQLADLDDLNTESPTVRRALRDAYGRWIRDVGVDGFRVDTAFYVPPDFFHDFLSADDRRAPGVLRVAQRTGRDDFLVFGEGFGIDRAYEERMAHKIDGYLRAPSGQTALSGMLNFPLFGTLADVFGRGQSPAELGHRITSMMRVHEQPWRMPSFIDNHDVDRFLSYGDEAGLRQALLAMMTLPGIPVIYAGTEQGFREQRAALFAGGFGAGGRDHFDRTAPLYRDLKAMIALRRGHAVLRRGTPTVLGASPFPGVLAYRMDDGDASALIVFNTADTPRLADGIAVGWPARTRLKPGYALAATAEPDELDDDGRLTRVLPPRSAFVWWRGEADATAPRRAAPTMAAIDETRVWTGDLPVQGQAAPGERVRVVVDGDLAQATSVRADASGHWQVELSTDHFHDAAVVHRVVAWSETSGASLPRTFRAARDWQLRAFRSDPAGDDHGPDGRYVYPTEAGFATHPQDLRSVRVYTAGRALRMDVELAALSTAWAPPRGFDHVALTVFVSLPNRPDGARVLPLQFATLPDDLRWQYRLRAQGWSSAWFSAEGATADEEGRRRMPGPSVGAVSGGNVIRIDWPAAAFDDVTDWRGARFWVTTWDYDAGYRTVAAQPQGMVYGGGDPTSPRIMDASDVLTIE